MAPQAVADGEAPLHDLLDQWQRSLDAEWADLEQQRRTLAARRRSLHAQRRSLDKGCEGSPGGFPVGFPAGAPGCAPTAAAAIPLGDAFAALPAAPVGAQAFRGVSLDSAYDMPACTPAGDDVAPLSDTCSFVTAPATDCSFVSA